MVVDSGGTIIDANTAAEGYYGYSLSEFVGMNISQLRADGESTELRTQLAAALAGGILFETEHVRSDGTTFPVEVSARSMKLADGPGIVSVIRDISRRRANEKERERLLGELEASNRQLEGLLQIVSGALYSLEPEDVLSETLETLAQLVDADAVILLEAQDDAFVVTYETGAETWAPSGFRFALDVGFAGRVVAAGAPVQVSNSNEKSWFNELHPSAKVRTMFGVPMLWGGSLFGVLELAWMSERQIGADQSALVQLAADRITLAVMNARVFERSRRTAILNGALNEVGLLVNGSLNILDTVQDALRAMASGLGCEVVAFGSPFEDVVTVSHSFGLSSECTSLSLTPDTQASLFRGECASMRVEDAESRRWLSAEDGTRIRQALMVPVEARARRFGVIVLGSARDGCFDAMATDYAHRFAEVTAQALANAEDYAHEYRIAETLQEAFLMLPSSVRGVTFSHLYRAATVHTRIGGDFYDCFELSSNRVGLVIGDVSGKDLHAAILTSVIKDTIRAYAHESFSPAEVITRVNRNLGSVSRLPEFASAFYAVIDTTDGTMAYCSAGHPPAVILSDCGSARLLPGMSPVIGVSDELEFDDQHLILSPHETLVLYTDGVTEARDAQGHFFGEERLIASLEAASPTDIRALPTALMMDVMSFTEGRLTDDVAIMALRLA